MKHHDIIKKMTLEEKAAFLSGVNEWQSREIKRLQIPAITCSDGPHGIRRQAGAGDHLGLNESLPATCFPTAATIANSWDEALGNEIGEALGEEAAAQEVDVLLGPGLNMKRSPLCGRNFEYFSEDPYLAGKMAAAYIRGIQSKGVYACPKHFAVNNQELRRMAMNSVVDERTLREIYLTGFEIAVKEGKAKAIMSSYNEVNGTYANENKHLLREILREDWGFDGIVITDWGASNDHVKGVAVGSNLEMPVPGLDSAREILEAVNKKQLTMEELDSCVDSLLDAVLDLTSKREERKKRKISQSFSETKHHELAKNADVVLYCFGLDEISESEGLDRTHMRISQNQVALLEMLARVNENIVGIISAGSAIEMPWQRSCKAILHGYLYGQAGAAAMMELLMGNENPSGRLSETYPFKYEDTPAYRYFPSTERNSEYREALYIGYRYYDSSKVRVRYPFGFGLSYTEFVYSDLKISSNGVRATVQNTGKYDGEEVVQLYVGLPNAIVFRPEKELKGFKKVFIKAGERKEVEIPFDDKTFRYWNVKTGKWEIEEGNYQIMVGASVSDIRLSGNLEMKGTTEHYPYNPAKMPHYYTGIVQNIEEDEFEELLGYSVPSGKWTGELGINDAICQMYYAKSGLARFIYNRLTAMKKKSEATGKPDLNILFIYNMPFRALAKMTAGMVSMEMAEGMVTVVNGHFFKGMKKIIGGFFKNRKLNKEYTKMLSE